MTSSSPSTPPIKPERDVAREAGDIPAVERPRDPKLPRDPSAPVDPNAPADPSTPTPPPTDPNAPPAEESQP